MIPVPQPLSLLSIKKDPHDVSRGPGGSRRSKVQGVGGGIAWQATSPSFFVVSFNLSRSLLTGFSRPSPSGRIARQRSCNTFALRKVLPHGAGTSAVHNFQHHLPTRSIPDYYKNASNRKGSHISCEPGRKCSRRSERACGGES